MDGVISGKAGLGGAMNDVLKKEQLLTTRQLHSYCIARKYRHIFGAATEGTLPSTFAKAVENVSEVDNKAPARWVFLLWQPKKPPPRKCLC